MGKCIFLSELSVLPAPEPESFRGRFGVVSKSSFPLVFYSRIASRPQSDCKKPAHGGMQNFALRRVLVFYSRIEALMQSDCKKPMETTTSKRPRNDFETTPTVKNQYTAECKILISAQGLVPTRRVRSSRRLKQTTKHSSIGN